MMHMQEEQKVDEQVTDHYKRVREFMRKVGQGCPDTPTIPDDKVLLLRAKLILEEVLETINKGMGLKLSVRYIGVGAGGAVPVDISSLIIEVNENVKPDLVEIADGCADISVVSITGTLIACGIKDKVLLEVIDASNLDKFRGDAHRREDGKWIKPSDWKPPDIVKVLEEQGWEGEDF